MEQHALTILELKDLWNWRDTKRIRVSGDKFQIATPKLLYFLIVESQRFGGEVLDHFWKQLGTCDEKLKGNSLSRNSNHSIVQAHIPLSQSKVWRRRISCRRRSLSRYCFGD